MKPLLLGYDARERPLSLKPDDRKIHMHVIGASDSGKSKFLESMMREDLKNRQGFALLDPHGTLYDEIVTYCARHLPDRDIILLNLSNPENIVGFNPFQRTPDGDISVQVDARVRATMHAWNVQNTDQTPTLARTLWLIYTVMLEQHLGLPQVQHLIDFNARDVRTFLIDKLQSPLIQSEWRELHALKVKDWRQEMLSAKNRLFKLLTSEAIKRFMGLPGFSINLGEIIEQGKVLLVNLRPSKDLSLEGARTFGALLVSDLFETAVQRERPHGRDPKPYYLYMDEFQNFVSLDIANMLDQVRKFGLFLILAHQRFGQLDENVIDAALNNCQIKAVFGGLSVPNARRIAEELFIGKLDPMKIKVAIKQTKFWPEYRRDKAYGRAHSHGHAHGLMDNAASASSSGLASGQSFFSGTDWLGSLTPAATSTVATSGSNVVRGTATSDTDIDTSTESEIDLPILIPVPFEELSSIQFYSPEEQLIELTAALKKQFQRHCFIQIRQQETQPMLVPFVKRVSTFDYVRGDLERFIQRKLKKYDAHSGPEVELLLKEQEIALLQMIESATDECPRRASGRRQSPRPSAAPLWDRGLSGTSKPADEVTQATKSSSQRQRGPKAKTEEYVKLARIVTAYGKRWKEPENLLEICEKLDKERVPIPPGWPSRKTPAHTWKRQFENDAHLVAEVLIYRGGVAGVPLR